MSLRAAWRRLSGCRRPWPELTGQSRRLSSKRGGSEQTSFSYFAPNQKQSDDAQIFSLLRNCEVLANPRAHNAAVVLTTPHYSRLVGDSAFVGEIARLLSGDSDVCQFHICCAVVDNLTPIAGESEALRGMSVLRGHLDDTLPDLWLPSPPKPKEDAELVSSLTFNLGSPYATLPLARTTFHNSRPSTLITSRFNMTTPTSPELAQMMEKHSQRVIISSKTPARSIADLGLWAPLSPLTRPRFVTESFGNIIRGVRIKGKSEPASTELEAAVETIFKHRPASSPPPGPVGIWAMVTPRDREALEDAPDPAPILQGGPLTREAMTKIAKNLEQFHQSGGRFYQILSGGGGWGSKKGLLSLDPERTYMVDSEEEAMARFAQTMEGSDFAPPGSQIQFFTTAQASPQGTEITSPGTIFGVPNGAKEAVDGVEVPESGYLVHGHFGALSSKGIFVAAGRAGKEADALDESKLSVPGSRIHLDVVGMEDR